MIKLIEAKMFRKHEDISVTFTPGLNVLRGPNECGKTTITEIVLYCLYGSAALIDTLAEVCTWGHKESELKASLIITISGVDYFFQRSKAGAEANYLSGDQVVKVTGQKEVSAFAASLLGADAKTASVLMLSSQAGLRGALDEGATAVGALMSKLADFDTIDRLLQTAAETLSLGSAMPLTVKLTEAENEALHAKEALVDADALAALSAQRDSAIGSHATMKVLIEKLQEAVSTASDKRDAALSNNRSVEVAKQRVDDAQAAVTSTQALMNAALLDSDKRPAAGLIEKARSALADAENHDKLSKLFALFMSMPAYPEVAWDSTKETFDAEIDKFLSIQADMSIAVREIDSDIQSLKRQVIVDGGKCPTCGHLNENHEHTARANLSISMQIEELERKRVPLTERRKELDQTVATLKDVIVQANRRQVFIDKLGDKVVQDFSVYPSKLSWAGPVVSSTVDIAQVKRQLVTLEEQERSAVEAGGRAAAHRSTLARNEAVAAQALEVLALMAVTLVQPLQDAYDAAYEAYINQAASLSELAQAVAYFTETWSNLKEQSNRAQERLAAAEARIVEVGKDIEALEFNNELVKKLKSMKPMITDHLWSKVLVAVGNFFTQLRGETSVVTKDATGFKVNGRGGSLSGSTLDVLALAIRVALCKTFVPHSSFLILDEPAHGADETRTENILGFLQGAGFHQVILASHDPVSQNVADNVITLGTYE
jgi:DNA repair exonuclease SbcCD ATPase subunit